MSDTGVTVRNVVSQVAGRAVPNEEADFILWEYTGFPEFFHIPRDGNTPEECLRTELKRHFFPVAMKWWEGQMALT